MTHKQSVIAYCKEHLATRQLVNIFNSKEFERIYRDGGSQANPYLLGLRVADILIKNFHLQIIN